MILMAQALNEGLFKRYLILNHNDGYVWDGEKFVEDWDLGMVFASPTDACAVMQQILREFYKGISTFKAKYVVPIEVEVWGNVTQNQVARYMHRASYLNIKTHEHGNGPAESLVMSTIHWARIEKAKEESDLPSTDTGDKQL